MSKPTTFKRGDRPPTARTLEGMRRAGAYRVTGDGVRVSQQAGSIAIVSDEPPAGHTILAKITSIAAEYLVCEYFTPNYSSGTPVSETSPRTVYVAKPFLFRPSHFDGKSWTFDNGDVISYSYSTYRHRTATKGVDTEDQVITPDYCVGEIIRAVSGYTGILGPGTAYCYYEDIGTGRAWAKES